VETPLDKMLVSTQDKAVCQVITPGSWELSNRSAVGKLWSPNDAHLGTFWQGILWGL